jgi:citrate lyase subunit beta/citryl-CoA lyase
MQPRSILFVPGDSEKKIARGASCGADALIFDLEDSVAPARKDEARRLTRARLLQRADSDPALWVRINALDTAAALQDLAAVAAGAPDIILLPKAEGAQDVVKLAHFLDALEVHENMARGAIGIVVVATETAGSMFELGSYAQDTPRLRGLTWGAEDLASAVGASSNRDDSGLTPLYLMARSLCLAAAARAGVLPIDTACMEIRELSAIEAETDAARRDGFRAKLAIHPDQVSIINNAFSPSEAEIKEARAIVAAYDADPNLGTFQRGGRMIDIPHLKQARQLLAALA